MFSESLADKASSPLLLANPRNNDKNNVVVKIQGEGEMLIITPPARMRKTKPKEMQRTSIMAMCFKYSVYERFKSQYIKPNSKKYLFRQKLPVAAMKNSTKDVITAALIEIFPEARGRSAFLGCFLSFSKSTISFSKYMLDEKKQKIMNPVRTLIRTGISVICFEKKKGATTKTFLTHSRGRILSNRYLKVLLLFTKTCLSKKDNNYWTNKAYNRNAFKNIL
ncbi:MAG: hypothetical protein P9M03_09270 [Candidatus Theseobacter exili]|nr:hypothetical protein [Candidatus Theseobacter exili]